MTKKKAIFSKKQPKVKVTASGGMNWFQICLNENETTYVNDGMPREMVSGIAYEYDFNEWHDSTTKVEDVQANPEKYIDYAPSIIPTESAPTLSDRIKALENQQAVTAQAVQDMILMQEG